ncbi:anhydro-N-acetylmuramic acid kinase [Halorhodospira abdelmalekii]|uniref:anhydro-N-acetylmuramic acid kinase n=1 Tax=Halorhodospira abdelmalekii TaxID=421629 RepID=UPI001903BB0A|nr:anhydro-N-acetylmuramic acid kinase [Halorhodospira abdelmalekii]MBK1736025.1 anhydro-N-acetylmuramic acid kinase [Halorhodospira abdelmalekii]
MTSRGALYIGLMSGTSVDGVDVALARFSEHGELTEVLHTATHAIAPSLQAAILASGPHTPLGEICRLDQRLTEAFVDAITAIPPSHFDSAAVAAIGCHGQTVWHASTPGEQAQESVQLGNGNQIAAATGSAVVADFRRRDIAEGGQGAPLTPAFHAHCLADSQQPRVILNLGGIANLTLLAMDGTVTGFDTGPANGLLDRWIERHCDRRYDADGAWATTGTVDRPLLERLLGEPYFAHPPPKSTGPELFSLAWLERHLHGDEHPADVQATLSELTAVSVADALHRWAAPLANGQLFACGGGCHNSDLMARLSTHCAPLPVSTTAALGVDPDYVEALAFAWLAWARLHHRPGNLPSVTGADRSAVLGALYAPSCSTPPTHSAP